MNYLGFVFVLIFIFTVTFAATDLPKTANRLGTNAFFACSIYPNERYTKYEYLKLTSLALSTEAEGTFDLLFNGFLAARSFLAFAGLLVFNLTFNWPGLIPDFPGIFALALDIVIKLHKVHFFDIFCNFAQRKIFSQLAIINNLSLCYKDFI